MHFPNVSILLVNYNSKKYAEEAIDSILKQNYPKSNIQIIVVDNASSDGSIEFLKERFGKQIELVESKENLGFAGGTNIGLKYVKGEMVLFFNIDAIAPTEFLKTIVSEALKEEKIAAVGSFDFPPGTNLKNLRIDGGYTLSLTGSNIFNISKDFKTIGGGGVGLLIKKNKMPDGLDGDYFLYFEETKLCWELNAMGYDVITPPTCRIWHYGSSTTGKKSPLKTYYSERNRIMTLRTCFETPTLIKLAPLFFVDFITRFGYYIVNSKLFVPFMKALFWNITNFSTILKKKKEFDSLRKKRDKELFHLFSYKLFQTSRSTNNIWKFIDFCTVHYLKLVGIKTCDM